MENKYSFERALDDLKIGREIEFIYKKTSYAIVNFNGKWYFTYGDNETELCGFNEKSLLIEKVARIKIDNIDLRQIIDFALYEKNSLCIL